MAHKPHVYRFCPVNGCDFISPDWAQRNKAVDKNDTQFFFFMIICLLPGKNNKPRVMVLTLKKKKIGAICLEINI